MERRSTVLLGEAQEHFVVEIAARLEMMCRGMPTEPVPQEEIDRFTKVQADKEARRTERIRQEQETVWNGLAEAPQFLINQFPLGFNPFQPPPMFDPYYHHQYMQRVSPMNQGHVWPHCGSQIGEHQGYQMPHLESYFAEFPPLNGQQYPLNQGQGLRYPVPNYSDLPLAFDDRHQVLPHEGPQQPHISPRSSSLLAPEHEAYYVELNKSFLRIWARLENLCMRELIYFDEELFLKLAEWATPAPPGFIWTSWGLISVID